LDDSVEVDCRKKCTKSRKFFRVKNIDPKPPRANNLRTRICAGRAKAYLRRGRMSCRFCGGTVCPDLRVAEMGVIICKRGRDSNEGRNCKSNIADFLCCSSIFTDVSLPDWRHPDTTLLPDPAAFPVTNLARLPKTRLCRQSYQTVVMVSHRQRGGNQDCSRMSSRD
jgi:hypothetical protein